MIPFIGAEEFVPNKEATGREQDRLDASAVRRRLQQRL